MFWNASVEVSFSRITLRLCIGCMEQELNPNPGQSTPCISAGFLLCLWCCHQTENRHYVSTESPSGVHIYPSLIKPLWSLFRDFCLFRGWCSNEFFRPVSSESLCHCASDKTPLDVWALKASCMRPASVVSNYCLPPDRRSQQHSLGSSERCSNCLWGTPSAGKRKMDKAQRNWVYILTVAPPAVMLCWNSVLAAVLVASELSLLL